MEVKVNFYACKYVPLRLNKIKCRVERGMGSLPPSSSHGIIGSNERIIKCVNVVWSGAGFFCCATSSELSERAGLRLITFHKFTSLAIPEVICQQLALKFVRVSSGFQSSGRNADLYSLSLAFRIHPTSQLKSTRQKTQLAHSLHHTTRQLVNLSIISVVVPVTAIK